MFDSSSEKISLLKPTTVILFKQEATLIYGEIYI